jgi:hypothetical protein
VLANRSYLQNWMNFASNYFSAINIGKYARHYVNTVLADSHTQGAEVWVLAQDTNPSELPYTGLPLDYYASGPHFLWGRKQWDTSSTWFLWQMGRAVGNETVGHTHGDVGNFNIWRGGRWLSRETAGYQGGDSFTSYAGTGSIDANSSLVHNKVVFATRAFYGFDTV